MIKKIISFIAIYAISATLFAAALAPTDIPSLYIDTRTDTYTDQQRRYQLQGELLDLGGGTGEIGADIAPESVAENIAKRLQVEPTIVERTPITGIYIAVFGDLPKYVESSGRFLFRKARLIDAQGKDFANTVLDKAKQVKQQQNIAILQSVNENDLLVYTPEQASGEYITVFTDVDCPFCQQLHQEVPQYLQAGMSVRYILFPRSGKPSPAYVKAASVWCSQDPLTALDLAESGNPIPEVNCEHPLDEFLQIARAFNLLGTPAIMLKDGRLLHGYHSFDEVMRLVQTK